MNFDFYMPTQLLTGRGAVAANAEKLKSLGDFCYIVTSGTAAVKSGALDDVISTLESADIKYHIHDTVEQNPLLLDAHMGGEKARQLKADFVLGIGGGSPIDAAKVVAIFATNPMESMDIYKYEWQSPPLPIVCIGTTAGTGTEVNPFAVLTTPQGKKQSVSHPSIFPKYMLGDAAYTSSLPLDFTISTSLDAFSHAIEGFFSVGATKTSDIFAAYSIKTLIPLFKALAKMETKEEITLEMREELYFASIMAGFTLNVCRTVYCHAFGYFLSEDYGIPHGIACAIFLPHFLEREKALLPDRAKWLEGEIGVSFEELSKIISVLIPKVEVTLSDDELKARLKDALASANTARTAPDGMKPEEAADIFKSHFSK